MAKDFRRELLGQLSQDSLIKETGIGALTEDQLAAILEDTPAVEAQLTELSQMSVQELLKNTLLYKPEEHVERAASASAPSVSSALEQVRQRALAQKKSQEQAVPDKAVAFPVLEQARQRALAKQKAREEELAASAEPVKTVLSPALEQARQRALGQQKARAKEAAVASEKPIRSPMLEQARQRALKQQQEQEEQQKELEQQRIIQVAQAAEMALAMGQSAAVEKTGQSTKASVPPEKTPPTPVPAPYVPSVDLTESANARLECQVQEDGMLAKLELFPPVGEGRELVGEEILAELTRLGIRMGVKKEFAVRLGKHPVYGLPFKIAQGKLPVDGVDGKVIHHFNVDESMAPRESEDGTVDYKDLSYGKSVSKGDILCDLIPPTPGTEGYDVYGNVLEAHAGTKVPPLDGAGTTLSPDGLQLIASVDGEIAVKNGKVIINRSLSLDNIDSSTGNINFVGSVTVRGDVKSGFTLKAGGDIKIGGIAEGAVLEAGGNVGLGQGMNGGGGLGSITAGGNVRARFLENAHVDVKGDLYADSVLNCDINCGGKMMLVGTRGCIMGGSCVVAGEIRAKDIGNESEVVTRVEITGVNEDELRRQALREQVKQFEDTVARLDQLGTAASRSDMDEKTKQAAIVRAICTKARFINELEELREQLHREELTAETEETPSGRLIVTGFLYPNVNITIKRATTRITQARKFCVLRKKNGEIIFGNAAHY